MNRLDFGLTLDEMIPPRWWMWLLPWKWPRCLRYRRMKGKLAERGDVLIGYRGSNFYTAGGPWIVCLNCGNLMDCETGCKHCAEDSDA